MLQGEKFFHLKLDIEREIEMRNIVEIKEVFKTIDKEEILVVSTFKLVEGEIYGFRTERCWKNNVNEMYVNLINNYIR